MTIDEAIKHCEDIVMAEIQNRHYLCVGIEDEFHKWLKEAVNYTNDEMEMEEYEPSSKTEEMKNMIEKINLEKLKAIMPDYENFDDIFLKIEEENDGPKLTFSIIDRDDIEFEFASLDEGGELDMMYSSINVLESLKNYYDETYAEDNEPQDEEIIYEDLIEFILYGFKDDIEEEGQLLMDISSALMLEGFGND